MWSTRTLCRYGTANSLRCWQCACPGDYSINTNICTGLPLLCIWGGNKLNARQFFASLSSPGLVDYSAPPLQSSGGIRHNFRDYLHLKIEPSLTQLVQS